MKNIVASRLEHYLAKIAGRDIDLSTLTPPVASDMTELLLSEIADRLDGIGGGSSSSARLEIVGTPISGGFELNHSFKEIFEAYPNVYLYFTNDNPSEGTHGETCVFPAMTFSVTHYEDGQSVYELTIENGTTYYALNETDAMATFLPDPEEPDPDNPPK